MKKLPIFLSVFSIFAFIITFSIYNNTSDNNINDREDSQPFFTKEKFRYQYDRLKDPATGKIPDGIRGKEIAFIRNSFDLDNQKANNHLLSSSLWSNRGPFEIGGRTRAFDLDIRNENILIAGGVSSGMWKSTDAGASWKKTSKSYQLHSVTCLAQDRRPGKENNWYYGTGEYWGNSADISGDGIYKSFNNGDSWSPLPSTVTNRPNSFDQAFDYIWNIVVDNSAPLDKDILYVATTNYGIFRSSDGGNSWLGVLGGSSRATFSDIAITSKGILYATLSSNNTSDEGIYRSTDGLKWTKITPNNFPANFRRTVIGIAPSDENQVYIVSETPNSGKETINYRGDKMYHSLWKYTYLKGDGNGDGGIWEDRSENLPKPEASRGQMNSQSGYNLVIKVKPDNPDVVFLGAVALYRSNSGFKNNDFAWIGGTCPDETCDYDYRYTNHHSDIHSLFFSSSNPNVLFTGSDGGIHKTIDDMSNQVEWISLNNGYFTTQFYTVAISHGPQNSPQILGGLQDNGTLLARTEQIENYWTNPLRADGFYCAIPDDSKFYYASQNATWQPKIKIWRVEQDENGNNIKQTRIDPAGGKDFIWNTPFLLDPNNNNIMYVAGGKMVWRNNNLSAIPNLNSNDSTAIEWDSLSQTRIDFKEDVSPIGEIVSALGVSTNPANILYYGTSTGNCYRVDNANTGDPTPIKIKGQMFPAGAYISSIVVNPDDAMKVVVSFSNYAVLSIFYSENGGETWLPISGNLEENPNGSGVGPSVNWVEILKYNDKYIYFAGTSAGLFSTSFVNGTNTAWQMEGKDEIGNVVVDMIDARHSDKFVVIGTHGIGSLSTYYQSNFTIPSATKLVSPQNESKHILQEVNLSWQPVNDAVFYEVQLSTDPEFIENVTILDGIAQDNTDYKFVAQGRVKYYWRVRTVNSGGASQFTQAWTFTSAIEPPNLIYPELNQLKLPTSLSLKWQAVDGATKYRLQFAKGYNISSLYIDTVIYGTEFLLENLESSKAHVWRVASIEDDYEGTFSQTYRFTTDKSTSVSNEDLNYFKPLVYPNPINNNSKLDFEINKADFVVIMVYDYSGKLIETKNYGFLNPGVYSYKLPFEKLNIGNYIIQLQNGSVKKLMKFNKLNK